MTDPSRLLVVGDLHGNHAVLAPLFRAARDLEVDAIVQVGDFGYWPHTDGGAEGFMGQVERHARTAKIPLYWIDGNHENHDMLSLLTDSNEHFVQMTDHVHHIPRGMTWQWSGRSLLGLGGAYSVDKVWRVASDERRRQEAVLDAVWLKPAAKNAYMLANKHYTWWPGEEITDAQVHKIRAEERKVDVMFTHDKPLESRPRFNRKEPVACLPNQNRIQAVVDHVRPELLLHGHLHFRYNDEIAQGNHVTRVVGLDAEGVNNHSTHDLPRRLRNPESLADVLVLLDLPTLTVTDVLMP